MADLDKAIDRLAKHIVDGRPMASASRASQGKAPLEMTTQDRVALVVNFAKQCGFANAHALYWEHGNEEWPVLDVEDLTEQYLGEPATADAGIMLGASVAVIEFWPDGEGEDGCDTEHIVCDTPDQAVEAMMKRQAAYRRRCSDHDNEKGKDNAGKEG